MNKITFLIVMSLLVGCFHKDSNLSEKDLNKIINERVIAKGCKAFNKIISSSGNIHGMANELLAVSYIAFDCGGNSTYPEIVIIDKDTKKIISSSSFDSAKIFEIKGLEIKDNLLAINYIAFKDEDPRCCPSDKKEMKLAISNSRLVEQKENKDFLFYKT